MYGKECIVNEEGIVFCGEMMCDACFQEDDCCEGCPMIYLFRMYNYVQEDIKKNGSK